MQLRKTSSFKLLMPTRAVTGMWYRLMGWTQAEASHLDDERIATITPHDAAFKDMSFTFAAIALSARVATASGQLTSEKYAAFRDAFPLSGGMCRKIRKLFAMACADKTPFEHYVLQVKHMFPRQIMLFASLVDRLFRIAAATGMPGREEERLLARIAHMLELNAGEYTDIRDRYINPKPHLVLGVEKRASPAILKKRYHSLMREVHPDRFARETLSPEVTMLLQLKASEINEAYRVMRKRAA